MTTNPTNQTNIPEPTSLTSVAVGKRDGETVVATRMDGSEIPWLLRGDGGFRLWRSWDTLCRELTDIRVVDVPEVAAEINQLTDRVVELEAAAIYAKVVHLGEMESRARLLARIAGLEEAKPEPEPEPEPGADIPDEVVKAAVNEWRQVTGTDREAMRAALAAADAKRAELEGRA